MPSTSDFDLTPAPSATPVDDSTLFTTSEDIADFALFAPQIQLKRPPQLGTLEQQPKSLVGWLFSI